MLTIKGTTFPSNWIWGRYEKLFLSIISEQIKQKWPTGHNVLVNTTWFGPTFDNGIYEDVIQTCQGLDRLFLLATVDPMYLSLDNFTKLISALGNPEIIKLGNYDNTPYEFNFFGAVLGKEFKPYIESELLPRAINYKFVNYNRKPRFHRVQLVKKIIAADLDKFGLQTLGKPDIIYDHDPSNTLHLTLNERWENYIEHGHWFGKNDPTGIPHDILSLHNIDYWRQHFLHIVGATMFWPWDDIFVSETQFKPIIGLRPFVINGNTRTYQWLTERGFKTFNHWFAFADLENLHEDAVHENILLVLQWLATQSSEDLMNLYAKMLPDLRYNRQRFFEYSLQQNKKILNLFDE